MKDPMCLCPKNNFGMGSATTIFKKDSFDSLCKNYQTNVFTDKFNQTEKKFHQLQIPSINCNTDTADIFRMHSGTIVLNSDEESLLHPKYFVNINQKC